jgi:cystathionine beta-lyase/cystathionine gamma-synthase
MITLELRARRGCTPAELAARFVQKLRLFTFAVSLGAVESLVELPASMTHGTMDEAAMERAGLSAGAVRLSVGVEDVEDLLRDVRSALDALG